MEKIALLLIFFFVCVFEYGFATKKLKDEDVAHNKCLTWDDSERKLNLTCRIPSSSSYVKFYHEESKTNVTCNVEAETLNCYPRDKIIHSFRKGKQISVMFHESKIGKELSGDWFCQTNKLTLKATVNLIEGVITDLWVKIRGSIKNIENGKRNLSIECSSCRMPFKNYTEIWIDDKSSNGIRLNEFGDCILEHGSPCHPNQCSCSGIGNMFRISYEYPALGTNITCLMNFEDKYRNGKYQVTVNAVFNGTDFSFNSTQIFHTVKKPILITTPEPSGSVVITVGQTTVNNTTNDNQELNDNLIIIPVIIVSIIGIIFIIFLIKLVIYFKRKKSCLKLKDGKNYKDKNQPTDIQDEFKNSHGDSYACSPLLEGYKSSDFQAVNENVVTNTGNKESSSTDGVTMIDENRINKYAAVNENDVNYRNNEFKTTDGHYKSVDHREHNATVSYLWVQMSTRNPYGTAAKMLRKSASWEPPNIRQLF